MKTTFLSLYIAVRLHRNSKKNKMISFISAISIIGNSLSIAILITCLSAIHGFKNELYEKIFSIIPHGNIQSTTSKFHNWTTILNKIKKIPEITQIIPYINFSGLIEKNNKFHPIQIYGINSLYSMHPNIINYLSSINTIKNFISNQQIIILGQGAADSLNIQKNDWINILINNPYSKGKTLLKYKLIHVKIIDTLNLKSYLDHNLAIIPLLDSQNYLNKTEDISGINIKTKNIFHIHELLNQIKIIINDNHVVTQSWINTYKYIYQDIRMMKIIIYVIMILVISIACFSIVSILTLIIKEKNRDLAILNTLGSKKCLIYSIFIWYGVLNSFISIIVGGTSGILLSLNLTNIYNIVENTFKYKILTNNVYFINFLPTEIHIKDVILICSLHLLLSLLATLYPTIRTKNINFTTILK